MKYTFGMVVDAERCSSKRLTGHQMSHPPLLYEVGQDSNLTLILDSGGDLSKDGLGVVVVKEGQRHQLGHKLVYTAVVHVGSL